MKIAIIGNGYVGAGMVRLFGRSARHEVLAHDIDPHKGVPREEVLGADLAIVCVPTPSVSTGITRWPTAIIPTSTEVPAEGFIRDHRGVLRARFRPAAASSDP